MSTLIGSCGWLSPTSVDFEKFDIQVSVDAEAYCFSQALNHTCGMLRF